MIPLADCFRTSSTRGAWTNRWCDGSSTTAWAARRTRTATDFYAAGKGLTAAQNGFALAGDWCSAAAFLGMEVAVSVLDETRSSTEPLQGEKGLQEFSATDPALTGLRQ